MHIYAVALEKGGVGTSALAVNLAAAFARINLRAPLIDLDAQANATHWLGVPPATVRSDETTLGLLMARPSEECVRTTNEGVDLLVGAWEPALAGVGEALVQYHSSL